MPSSAASCRAYATGTPTSMTTEACTLSGGNTVAQVTNTAKRILDPAEAVLLYDNGVLQAASTYTLNHCWGKATKASGSWTGPVTMSGKYLPQLELDETFRADIAVTRDVLESTVFKNGKHKTKELGLMTAILALDMRSMAGKDFDTGGGTMKLETWLTDEEVRVLEVTFPDTTLAFRMMGLLGSLKASAAVGALHQVTATYDATAPAGTSIPKPFAWSDE